MLGAPARLFFPVDKFQMLNPCHQLGALTAIRAPRQILVWNFSFRTALYLMARKSRLSKAAKAVTSTAKRLVPTRKEARTVAGVALGAAAIAATGVVAKKVGDAVREGKAASRLQRVAVRSASRLRKSGRASGQRNTTKKRSSAKSSKRAASR